MKKIRLLVVVICTISMIGCSKSYDNDDIAAIVRGEEITVGELRFLYPDNKILDNLDGTIKATLAIQEVNKMNIDLSEELKEMDVDKEYLTNNFLNADVNNPMAAQLKEFVESQAEKFDMEVEEYYEKYYEETQKISIYVVAYIKQKLGEQQTSDDTYTVRANQLLDDLVDENEDEIEILIQR
ncbi:hypothetical protein [Paucisalibacillus globulus]|uniref:hypothetical protein n=1 Tax=Paucisalibacillus globulus TaxID=351095 RepID=UPI000BB788ED|nr:hypothetical protein [Paucisalibacillus globulus]